MVSFRFAPAAESDFERLVALRILVMRPHLERVGRFDPDRARQRFRDGFAPQHLRLILVEDALAGCLALVPDTEGWELTNFYLYPERQGGGLGSAVMRAVTQEADAAGATLHLQVLKQSPAARLYERHGFRQTHDDAWDDYYRRAPLTTPPNDPPNERTAGDSRVSANQLEVNAERLWDSLERSAEIGKFRDVGLRRLALSGEDKQMRDLFVEWVKDAGCSVAIDELGNIFARRPGRDPSLPPVAIGSHLDTQICGGRYDGILGVLCGLEVVRTLNDRGIETRRGIEVICWTNEEGARFSPPMMGSMAFAGLIPIDAVRATADDAGVTVETALREIGYAGPEKLGDRRFDSYLELHIEQAPVLDREGCDVGVVIGGYKTQALKLTIKGDTGHAGGTPMGMRRNALVGAGYVIAAHNDIGLAYAQDEGRTTTTRIESFPNLPGTYAEEVKLTIDFRHIDGERFKAMRRDVDAAIADAARKANVEIEVVEGWSWGSELFDPDCIALLKSTAEELGMPYREMRSQAGHDAYAVATMAPTAMIFTPCHEGISHNVNENIELARSLPGANLLLNAAVARANR